MGKWQPKLSELLSEYIDFDSFNSSTPPPQNIPRSATKLTSRSQVSRNER